MVKRLVLLVVVSVMVAVCGSTAVAVDFFGPPCGQLPQGQTAYGIDYTWTNVDLHHMRTNWSSADKTLDDFEMHKVGARVEHGPSDSWDVFGRAGAIVSPEWSRDVDNGAGGFDADGDTGWYVGGGGRATVWQQTPDLCWGASAQCSMGSFDGSMKGTGSRAGDRKSFDIDITEVQVGVGPCWTAAEGVQVYGGACWVYTRGWHTEAWPDGDRSPRPIEQRDTVGVFVGGQFDVGNDCSVCAEWMTTGSNNALGLNLMCRR